MHLDMPVYALVVAGKGMDQFPGSPRIEQATAAIWMVAGFSEEALFLLQRTDGEASPMLLARLMQDTERLKEANKLRRTFGAADIEVGPENAQHFLLPPAEGALDGEWLPVDPDPDTGPRAESLAK